MAKYSDGSAILDAAITVGDEHLLAADTEVDLVLAAKGIAADAVVLPSKPLELLANAYACVKACRDQAVGEGSPLIAKAASYEREAARLAGNINRAALGFDETPGSGSGGGPRSIKVGRA